LKIAQVYGYHAGCWRRDSLEFSRLGALKIADKFTIAMEAVGNPEKKGVTLAKARGE
jgi:hypothetical protein